MKNYSISHCLGDNVRLFRHKKHLSQKTLGDLVGVSADYIASIEKGVKYPSGRTVEALSEALGVSAFRLFMTDEDMFAHVTAEQWTEFQGMLEEVSVLTEQMHEMLERFQKET